MIACAEARADGNVVVIGNLNAPGQVVISGMNRVQFKTLTDCGLTKLIDLDNFVPDLEFAVARGMNLASSSLP